MMERFFSFISGSWYNDNIYFRWRLHKRNVAVRNLVRLLCFPAAMAVRLWDRLMFRTVIPRVEMSIMKACHDHCRDCQTLVGRATDQVGLELHEVIRDVEAFLDKIHRVDRFMITGDEPFLHENFQAVLDFLIRQRKIGLIHVVSRGSVCPGTDVLTLLRHPKVITTINSFPGPDSENKESFLSVLQQHQINYFVKDIWRDLGSFNPVAYQDEVSLKNRFAQCLYKNDHHLSGGKYHLCSRSAHGVRLGQYGSEESDFVNFKNHRKPALFRKELKKLLRKKYLAACRTCTGSRRETMVEKLFTKIEGDWYRQNIYYKYRIFAMPLWQQKLVRLMLLPASVAVRLHDAAWGKLEIPRVEMPITTRCNFLCRDCANLISSYRRREDEEVETLIQDVRDFLRNVGRVDRFIVMGGETFLYPKLLELIRFLVGQKKIKLIRLITNGSIIPDARMLEQLQHKKIIVSVSNYPESVSPGTKHLIEILRKHRINYLMEDNLWIDMGGFNPAVDDSQEALKRRFGECSRKQCHNISRGEYHLCPRSVHGERLGQFAPDASDKIQFRGMRDPKKFKAQLHQLLQKDYLQACTKCKGEQGAVIMKGRQMAKEK